MLVIVELFEIGVIGGVLKARLATDGRRGVDMVKEECVSVEAVVCLV